MSLCELINRLEAGAPAADDLGHPLALAVVAELGQCEKSEEQRKLFGDCRVLADHIIEQYLRLDCEDKLKMAEVYQQEGCFRRLGGVGGFVQKKLRKRLGKPNLELLLWISNYSKLIPVLERYITWVESQDHVNPGRVYLSGYLRSNNLNGRQVKEGSNRSLHSFVRYDFHALKRRMHGDHNIVLESILFGVNDALQGSVLDAHSLLATRRIILENYIAWIEGLTDVNTGMVSFIGYLCTHTIKGDSVKYRDADSLY